MNDAHNGKIHNDFQTGIPSQRIEGKKEDMQVIYYVEKTYPNDDMQV
jgi:hypothetical protein